jgi:hypothetical protein
MQVYRKILVTIDCSSVDDTIVAHVSALALQNNAQVALLHVVHSHTLDQHRVLDANNLTNRNQFSEKTRQTSIGLKKRITIWQAVKWRNPRMESIMQKETDNETNHDGSESSGRNKVDNENTSGGKNVGRGLGRGGGKGRRDGTGGGRGRGGGGKGGRRK